MKKLLLVALCVSQLMLARLLPGDLVNASLERSPEGKLPGWEAYYGRELQLTEEAKHSGATSVKASVTDPASPFGLKQVITYDKPSTLPIIFGGWAKLQSAGAGGDVNVYLDIFYEDGTNLWAVTADWDRSRRDWQKAISCVYPTKPVAKIEFFVLLRKTHGTAWFDDLFLIRQKPDVQSAAIRIDNLIPFLPNGYTVITKTLNPHATCTLQALGSRGQVLAEATRPGRKVNWLFTAQETPVTLQMTVRLGQKSQTVTRPFPSPVAPTPLLENHRPYQIWTADSMLYVTPQDPPPAQAPADIQLELARNERESAQILITAGATPLTEVNVTLSTLKRDDGTPFQGTLGWERVGYLLRPRHSLGHPQGFKPEVRWFPDPLLPPRPFTVPAHTTQAVWLTAHATARTAPGSYRGQACLTIKDKQELIPITLTVFDLTLPRTFSLPTAFAIMDGFLKAVYPEKNLKELRRKGWDIMLDHRLNPDDISRTTPPELDDLIYAQKRGMNRFNILNLVPEPTKPVTWVCRVSADQYTPEFTRTIIARLKPVVAQLRQHNLMQYAYLYGFDEVKETYFDLMKDLQMALKREFPDLPILSTSAMYKMLRNNPERKDCYANDWFCPLTSHYDDQLSQKLRNKGHKVWWYVCCGPRAPYANFTSMEHPLIEGRILPWQTYQHRADGLLFWVVNYWMTGKRLDESRTAHPDFPLVEIGGAIGDGTLLYPGQQGPLPSIRLANVRDGSEDYDYLVMLNQKEADAFCARLSKSVTDFSRDPKLLRQLRREMAGKIEAQPAK